jgi:serine/threonine protein kinase, bacterial
MFVANRASNAITVYADSANGNVKPLFHISGSKTGLSSPSSVGFDSARQLYVLNAASFVVFPPTARGNVTPKFAVSGGLTQLSNPQGLAVDPTGKTYVTNSTGGSSYITAYAPGSNGDRAPVQTIYDGVSFFFIPAGIAVHGALLYVADPGDQTINEYSTSANGIVNPVAVITGLTAPNGVAIDAQGRIYVTDSDTVVVYAANANGHATPLQTIAGSMTLMSGAAGLTVHNSEIAVANGGNNSITIYPESGNGNIPPLRQLSGANTGLSTPQSVAVR